MVDRMATMGISLRSRQRGALVHTVVLQLRMGTTAIHNSRVVKCNLQNSLPLTTPEFRSSLAAAQSPRNSSRLTSRGRSQRSARAGLAGNSPKAINETVQSSILPGRWIERQKFGYQDILVTGAAARSLGALARLDRASLADRSIHGAQILKPLKFWRSGVLAERELIGTVNVHNMML